MEYLYYLSYYYHYYFPKTDTRFYYLSLIKEENDKWSIHGLWPQLSETNYPKFCKRVSFSIEKLEPIIKKLEENWYSNDNKDEDFWKHEWEKHGSCVFTNITEFNYFNITLHLFDQAIKLDLPKKYYDEKTKKCLIPVNLDFVLKK